MRDYDRMRSLGEVVDTDGDDWMHDRDDQRQSVTQILKNSIISRAPDKMIDCLGSCILISYRNQIVYLDICKYEIDTKTESSKVIEVTIKDEELAFVDMDPEYKIIAMQHTGSSDMTSIVLEHLSTR